MPEIRKLSHEQEYYLDRYYRNNRRLLDYVVKKEVVKTIGDWMPDCLLEEFILIADEVLADIIWKYDESKGSFNTYFVDCFRNKVKTELTKLNALKRGGVKAVDSDNVKKTLNNYYDRTISIDAEENQDKIDKILENRAIEMYNAEFRDSSYEENVQNFLSRLTKRSRVIAEDIAEGFSRSEIQEIRSVSNKEYEMAIMEMRKFENISVLRNKCSYKPGHSVKGDFYG